MVVINHYILCSILTPFNFGLIMVIVNHVTLTNIILCTFALIFKACVSFRSQEWQTTSAQLSVLKRLSHPMTVYIAIICLQLYPLNCTAISSAEAKKLNISSCIYTHYTTSRSRVLWISSTSCIYIPITTTSHSRILWICPTSSAKSSLTLSIYFFCRHIYIILRKMELCHTLTPWPKVYLLKITWLQWSCILLCILR